MATYKKMMEEIESLKVQAEQTRIAELSDILIMYKTRASNIRMGTMMIGALMRDFNLTHKQFTKYCYMSEANILKDLNKNAGIIK